VVPPDPLKRKKGRPVTLSCGERMGAGSGGSGKGSPRTSKGEEKKVQEIAIGEGEDATFG